MPREGGASRIAVGAKLIPTGRQNRLDRSKMTQTGHHDLRRDCCALAIRSQASAICSSMTRCSALLVCFAMCRHSSAFWSACFAVIRRASAIRGSIERRRCRTNKKSECGSALMCRAGRVLKFRNQPVPARDMQVAFLPLLYRTASGCSLLRAVTGQAMVGPPRRQACAKWTIDYHSTRPRQHPSLAFTQHTLSTCSVFRLNSSSA